MWKDLLSRLPNSITGANRVVDKQHEHGLFDEPASKNLWVPYVIVIFLFLLAIMVPVVLYVIYF